MLLFHYHAETGVYLGSSPAEPDPLELQLARTAVFSQLEAAAQATYEADLQAAEMHPSEEGVDLARTAAVQTFNIAMMAAKAEADDVEPAMWLVPAHATLVEPPAFGFDEQAVWANETWTVAPLPAPQEEVAIEENLGASLRAERNWRINAVRWLIDRHRDEQALRLTTTLTGEDYQLVLLYVQALRDLPEQAGFPDTVEWPALPPELLATGA